MSGSRRSFLVRSVALGFGVVAGGPQSFGGEELAASRAVNSPFLKDNFAPVHDEVTAENLKVIGQLPAGLEGMFVRNGPNPQFPPRGRYHWFDGDGMLHGVRIRDGRASYLNRYVRTAGWLEEHAAGKSLFGGILEPPDLRRILAGKWPLAGARAPPHRTAKQRGKNKFYEDDLRRREAKEQRLKAAREYMAEEKWRWSSPDSGPTGAVGGGARVYLSEKDGKGEKE